STINPGSPRASTRSVHKHACFAIVESTNDNVGPHKDSETELVHDVLCSSDSDCLRIYFRHSFRSHFRFERSGVSLLEENCPAEIAHLDPIHVKNHDVAHATESQKFKNLVSEGAGADNQNARRRQTLLLPPRNQTLAVVAVFR